MTTFHLLNFGCRASQADGSALKRQLIQAGLREVASPDQGHLAVLNTCTVTATADAEVRQMIRRIHRLNPQCRIVVTGCYAQWAAQEIARLPGVVWVVGNSHKHRIAEVVTNGEESEVRSQKSEEAGGHVLVRMQEVRPGSGAAAPSAYGSPIPDPRPRSPDLPQILVGEIGEQFHFAPVFPDEHTRPTLKIQDGCNARCAFCVIPQVRGPSRSLAPGTVMGQIRELEQAGYKEIMLSGINLGGYGKDLDRRIPFLGLLERILAETSIRRVRISSIEPMDVSPQLIRLVATEPRLARHFHVPLQSGCDRMLRLMNRRYWAEQYAERILAIREQVSNCGIGADVMVGFPSETDHDHSTNLRFVESLPFTYLHIFPYSPRPGTPAAARPDQVNGRVARERAREIRAVIARKRQAFLDAQIGAMLSALTLDTTRDGARLALTSNYLNIALPSTDVPANTMLDVRAARHLSGMLYAYPDSAAQRASERSGGQPFSFVPSFQPR